MIKVEKTAKTLDEGIKNLMTGAKDDYKQNSLMGKSELSSYCKEKLENFESQTTVREGKKYIKVIYDRSVFAFIVKEDFKHFKSVSYSFTCVPCSPAGSPGFVAIEISVIFPCLILLLKFIPTVISSPTLINTKRPHSLKLLQVQIHYGYLQGPKQHL